MIEELTVELYALPVLGNYWLPVRFFFSSSFLEKKRFFFNAFALELFIELYEIVQVPVRRALTVEPINEGSRR